MVEVITQWPGHAAEEIERLVTLPTEVEMNGVPKMSVMRSISLYGLSDVHHDIQRRHGRLFCTRIGVSAAQRSYLSDRRHAITVPLASPSGLVYRYVLKALTARRRNSRLIEDWSSHGNTSRSRG